MIPAAEKYIRVILYSNVTMTNILQFLQTQVFRLVETPETDPTNQFDGNARVLVSLTFIGISVAISHD